MKKHILTITLLSVVGTAFSQVERDTLGTEVINVVKSYSPTVSDAFKIKSSPVIDTSALDVKKTIDYNINSFPVASTFTPAKGKAKVLRVNPSPPVYENYVSAGFGNFSTPGVELFAHGSSNRYNDFGMFIDYISSVGGINDVVLDDSYYAANVNLYYKQEERDFYWQIDGGANLDKNNWYGLSEFINYNQNVIEEIDERQDFTNIYANGRIDYKDSFFYGASVKANRFTDNAGTAETHFLAQPKIEFPVTSEYINVDARLEFLRGKFVRNYENTDDLNYTFFNFGINPNLEILRNNLTVNLGVKLLYSMGTGSGNENKGYYYPNISASYKLIDEVVTVYAGVTGDLHQNTFKAYANENPYISPTLFMRRTDEQYNGFLGVKGKLASNISYNLKGFYKNEKDKPMYLLNPSMTDGNNVVAFGYQAGNSFNVVYDTVKTAGAYGEISIDLSKQLKIGGSGTFNVYEVKTENRPWNLPALQVNAFADYNHQNWFAGANLFYVGSRKDRFSVVDGFGIPDREIQLGDYIDVNFNGGYKFNEKLTIFARANNILSSDYQKYANFYVQGLQIFGGLTYKFDL